MPTYGVSYDQGGLSMEEVLSIGRRTGKIVGNCKKRATFVLDWIQDTREFRNNVILVMTPEQRRSARKQLDMLLDSRMGTLRQRSIQGNQSLLVDKTMAVLEESKEVVKRMDDDLPMPAITDVARKIYFLESSLLDILLDDYKRCECGR